jgi:nucleotide-binding universal stress UspA family protein
MFQRILVPLDGSMRAEQALPVAARIARANGSTVFLMQVVSPIVDYSGGLSQVPFINGEIIESQIADANEYLSTMAASDVLAGIETKTEVSFGQPAQFLLKAMQIYGIDLVVLCSHGRTGLSRWVLGSVAHALVHQSSVPVLVLREGQTLAHVERALVSLDGSALSEVVLYPAAYLVAALAAPAEGALHLTQVVKVIETPREEGIASQLNNEAIQQAGAYLADAAKQLRASSSHLKLALTYSVEAGDDVAETLVNIAEQRGKKSEAGGSGACSFIAMSTHGRGGVQRWVMGSVTERVLSTTKLPMLIVRPQQKG